MAINSLVTTQGFRLGNEFTQLYRLGRLARAFAKMTGHSTELQCLYTSTENEHSWDRTDAGLQTVEIDHICGSEGRCEDYDLQFRPMKSHEKERWTRVLSAYENDVILPPIELVQVDDVYFVRDGHHRVSVAKHVGQLEIDALVTVWQHAHGEAASHSEV